MFSSALTHFVPATSDFLGDFIFQPAFKPEVEDALVPYLLAVLHPSAMF